MDQFVNSLSYNSYFIVLSGTFTFVGTVISILLLITSTKIKIALRKNNQATDFSKQKVKLTANFIAFRDNITKDNLPIDLKSKSEIRIEILSFRQNYSTLLSIKDKYYIWRLLEILKANEKKIDVNNLCLYLDNIISKFKIKEVL